MKNAEIALPRPPGVCNACIRGDAVLNAAVLAIYCRHNRTGAWMLRGPSGELSGLWSSMSPLTPENFAERISHISDGKAVAARCNGTVMQPAANV